MRLILISLCLLSVIWVSTAQTQDEDNLTLQDAEPRTLNVSDTQRARAHYTVSSEDAHAVQIVVNADETFDPVVMVVNSENRLLAYNNNSAQSDRASIHDLWLESGTYTIIVDSFNGVNEGDVTLTLTRTDPFSETVTEDNDRITINAHLPEDMRYQYAMPVEAGNTYQFTVRDRENRLDPYLRVLDADNTQLASNDDHGTANTTLNTLDAQISDWQASADGVILLEVRDFLGRSGDFELIILLERP